MMAPKGFDLYYVALNGTGPYAFTLVKRAATHGEASGIVNRARALHRSDPKSPLVLGYDCNDKLAIGSL